MAFHIVQKDITTLHVDAIVNPTDQHYSGGGGVDKQIHDLCGPALREATAKLPKLYLGEARVTEGFGLPCKYILHTSGPRWTGRSSLEPMVLGSCYRNSLSLANSLGCKSIAFPLIASKGKHYPKELAFTVAINAIKECLQGYPHIDITLALYQEGAERLNPMLLAMVADEVNASYIPDDNYVESIAEEPLSWFDSKSMSFSLLGGKPSSNDTSDKIPSFDTRECREGYASLIDEKLLKDLLKNPVQANLDKVPVDESFGAMLNRILKERELPHSAIYDELGMSNTGFWKILTGKSNPSKMTVFGIAIALKLSLDDTKEMLMKAGYAINQSSLQDIILSSLIQHQVYDRYEIDNLLYSLDLQVLPGAIID